MSEKEFMHQEIPTTPKITDIFRAPPLTIEVSTAKAHYFSEEVRHEVERGIESRYKKRDMWLWKSESVLLSPLVNHEEKR